MAVLEQDKADVNVLRLTEEHKREKEAYLLKIFELEKDLNQKQHSELEIARLKGKLQVMKYIECGDESVVEEKLGKELEQLEKLRNALIRNVKAMMNYSKHAQCSLRTL
ncbi:hypothetical protein ZOSMA_3G00100 [Zostera marina]|uniref:Uncharacterized protein n=1 Tax=Zostera marina TaxID=29655 RepID=A0A0K9P5S2_ZOSMR|nr:hypothetical protein ZOSMA_3G00100 [Zostera marina]